MITFRDTMMMLDWLQDLLPGTEIVCDNDGVPVGLRVTILFDGVKSEYNKADPGGENSGSEDCWREQEAI